MELTPAFKMSLLPFYHLFSFHLKLAIKKQHYQLSQHHHPNHHPAP